MSAWAALQHSLESNPNGEGVDFASVVRCLEASGLNSLEGLALAAEGPVLPEEVVVDILVTQKDTLTAPLYFLFQVGREVLQGATRLWVSQAK